MPLALEFASAWLRVLPIADIVTELERGLDLLEATEADVDERHGSIRQVFQASWGLLSARERDALLKLSVFRGGFTREAAREAADVGLPLLLALRNKSFLALEESGRFAQHPLVEVFVREQADSGDVDLEQARRRHAEYLFGFLGRRETIRNPAERDQVFTEIIMERANVRTAWQWAAQAGRDDLFNEIGEMLAHAFKASGREEELREPTASALARLPEGSRGWAKLALTFCNLLDLQHSPRKENEEAYGLLHQAFEAFQRHGDERGTAQSLNYLGIFAAYLGREDEALALWQQAREVYTQLGDQARVGVMLDNLIVMTLDPAENERLYQEVHTLFEKIGAWREYPRLFCNHAGYLSRTYGCYDQARELLQQALAKVVQSDFFERSWTLLASSSTALDQGDLVSAEEQALEGLEVMEPFSNPPAEGLRHDTWVRLGWVALAKGDVQGATEIAERTKDTVLRVRIALLHGDHERARQLLFEGDLDRLWRTDMFPRQRVWLRINALLLAAEVAAITGDQPGEAWEHLREALTLACELVFVPSALEAFVVVAPLLPSDEAEELLALAATHPAASFDTQQRARNLMTADPTGMGASVLTTEEVLERGRSLLKS